MQFLLVIFYHYKHFTEIQIGIILVSFALGGICSKSITPKIVNNYNTEKSMIVLLALTFIYVNIAFVIMLGLNNILLASIVTFIMAVLIVFIRTQLIIMAFAHTAKKEKLVAGIIFDFFVCISNGLSVAIFTFILNIMLTLIHTTTMAIYYGNIIMSLFLLVSLILANMEPKKAISINE